MVDADRRERAQDPTSRAPRLARADFGAPVDGFFDRQPLHLRVILQELRALIAEAAPEATASLKWGMPAYTIDGGLMCMLGAHKAHVNLVLQGPADLFADPRRLLSGEGENGRHLRLTSLDELPRREVRAWLRIAADQARRRRRDTMGKSSD